MKTRRFLFLAFPCALLALLACLIPGASSVSAAPVAKCSGWSVVNSPSPGKALNLLNAVASISANDIWAVGYSDSPFKYVRKTLIEHWNGTQWSLVPSPNPSSSVNELNAVAAVSTNDVWAVGIYNNIPLIEHWNGTQWSIVPGLGLGLLYGVTAVSTNDVWVVGHDNNINWKVVPSPNIIGSFTGVAAISAKNVWAVGLYNVNNSVLTLTEQWNGTHWQIVSSPNRGKFGDVLRGVTNVPGTNTLWTVGNYYPTDINSSKTLTLFHC